MYSGPDSTFVGMGRNPDGHVPDIPLGFGMSLSQDVDAMSYFGNLGAQEKTRIIDYIQGSATGEDAKNRIATAVTMLKQHDISFI